MNLARHRRGVAHVALLCAVIALLALTLAGEARSSETPDQLRSRLGRLEARKDRALLELYAAESALARAHAQVAEARGSVAVSSANLAHGRALLAERLRQLYRNGSTDAIAVVLGAGSLSDALDGIDLLRRSAANDETIVRDVRLGVQTSKQVLARARTDERELALRTTQKRQLLQDLRTRAQLTAARIAELEAAARAAQARADAEARRRAAARAAAPVSAPDNGDPGAGSGGGGSGGSGGSGSPIGGGSGTLTVEATAYNDTGSTASGIPAGPGVCATDWSVIPQGTRFYVPGYGECVAADTGGAIVGDRIDVWLADAAAMDGWGRRTVTITFL